MYTDAPFPEETIFLGEGASLHRQLGKVYPELIFYNHFLPLLSRGFIFKDISDNKAKDR